RVVDNRPAKRLVVAALRVVEGNGELLAVRLVEGDVRSLVLRRRAGRSGPKGPGPPDVLAAREDRVRPGGRVRIGDLRPVEREGFAAVHERGRGDHPLRRIAVLEVRVAGSARELVEAPCRIGGVVAGIAPVPVDVL